MSKLRLIQYVCALSLWLVATTPMFACTSAPHIFATCEVTEDCKTDVNYQGEDSVCVGGLCRCSNPLEEVCCPDGGLVCENEFYQCRPDDECGTSAPTITPSLPAPPCTSDDQCPGPPDSRCGSGRCEDGICGVVIRAGEAVDNQYPGDCQTLVCSVFGDVLVIMDPSDLPLDGNPCTLDLCHGDEPTNDHFPDGLPCPGEDSGICVVGQCRDCSQALGLGTCQGGLSCHDARCDSMECHDSMPNGQETSTDCGGPECVPCGAGEPCGQHSDCLSNLCLGGLCQKSTHTDTVKNDSETGADCGYPGGPSHMCKDSEGCRGENDCASAVCYLGVCQAPSCKDTVQNGMETGADCGGPDCDPCEE